MTTRTDVYRVLFTGSRFYTDREKVTADLKEVLKRFGCQPDQMVVIQGMAHGLDTIARQAAIELGVRVEDYPVTTADWTRYGKSAGHRRNARMVAAGAHAAIAYPLGESRGTRGCMKLADAAGIPVWNRTDAELCPDCEQQPRWIHSTHEHDYWACTCGCEFTITVMEVTNQEIQSIAS